MLCVCVCVCVNTVMAVSCAYTETDCCITTKKPELVECCSRVGSRYSRSIISGAGAVTVL